MLELYPCSQGLYQIEKEPNLLNKGAGSEMHFVLEWKKGLGAELHFAWYCNVRAKAAKLFYSNRQVCVVLL